MIWFFERSGVQLQCEIRPASEHGGFELAWTSPDGQAHIERSDDVEALNTRRREVEEYLKRDGWTRVGRVTPPTRFL
jgi:hypothetical protein